MQTRRTARAACYLLKVYHARHGKSIPLFLMLLQNMHPSTALSNDLQTEPPLLDAGHCTVFTGHRMFQCLTTVSKIKKILQ
jgi:hypothetical protein